jgi:hypothetical protein
MELVIEGLLAAMIFLLQPRLLTLVLLGLAVAPCALARFRRKGYLIVATAVLCVSMFLPFDIALGSYHFGSRRGTSPGGPHFVRYVRGMARDSYLIKTYGEYITGGCMGVGIISPQWIWVWD